MLLSEQPVLIILKNEDGTYEGFLFGPRVEQLLKLWFRIPPKKMKWGTYVQVRGGEKDRLFLLCLRLLESADDEVLKEAEEAAREKNLEKIVSLAVEVALES